MKWMIALIVLALAAPAWGEEQKIDWEKFRHLKQRSTPTQNEPEEPGRRNYVDPKGVVYVPSGDGFINTHNGQYYPDNGAGTPYDPRTGQPVWVPSPKND